MEVENNKPPVYKGYTPKQYSPLCHQLERFYFSHAKCDKFHDPLTEKQFNVVKGIVEKLSDSQKKNLNALIGGIPGKIDLYDSYIHERIKKRRMSEYDTEKFYRFLYWFDREVAIGCGFITRDKNKFQE